MPTDDSGATVHIAVGVLMERHNLDAAQAIALLSSTAFTAHRTIGDVALEIVTDPRHVVADTQSPEGS